ncbi:hypothetical protein [Actinokineospora enzanensis]|uniref:hypothetical protein n=1 Tax=Actinokineospora enzanensis TaxID=155975 RepID=UPI0003648B38|nr:hypothetical protein [Actinokineospora enzanensis]
MGMDGVVGDAAIGVVSVAGEVGFGEGKSGGRVDADAATRVVSDHAWADGSGSPVVGETGGAVVDGRL